MFRCNRIFLTLTYKCNAWCEKCANRLSIYANEDMEKALLDETINKLKKYNFKGELDFGTGETLLYPYLKYFIEKVLSINDDISLFIFTNGKLFSPELPKLYFNPRIKWIITLDGMHPDDLSNLQYNLNIEYVKQNIISMSKLSSSPRFCLNYTLNKKNITSLIDYLNFCLQVSPEKVYITKLKIFDDLRDNMQKYAINLDDIFIYEEIEKAKRFCKNNNLEVVFPENQQKKILKSKCWEGNSILSPTINHNGDISFCSGREDTIIANIKDEDLIEKWNNILEKLKNSSSGELWCKKCYSNNSYINNVKKHGVKNILHKSKQIII